MKAISVAPVIALALIVWTLPAQAQNLPEPRFTGASPNPIYLGAPGAIDAQGHVLVALTGTNLAASDDNHGAYSANYEKVWVRTQSPRGAWTFCGTDFSSGCFLQNAGTSFVNVTVVASKFFPHAGSVMEVKMWVASPGPEPVNADPTTATNGDSSNWSYIYAISAASSPLPPAAAQEPPPVLTRVNPAEFAAGNSTANFRLSIYGSHICAPVKVIFNGDVSSSVIAEYAQCGVDDNGSYLPAGTSVIHAVLPAKFHLVGPGSVSLAVDNGSGLSNALTIKFSRMIERLRDVLPQRPNADRPPPH
jgi:hypothetical protein